MHVRKVVVLFVILLFASLFVPVASARPVCTIKTPYVVGVTGNTTTYTCDKVFDAILVSASNEVAGANVKACLKSSSGAVLECGEGCGFVMFIGLGSTVSFITVTLGGLDAAHAACTPTAGTIEVQFGDTRDGGQF